MFAEIGVLWVDHVAVTTDRFHDTARHYLAMPNARVLRGPGWNAAQKVHFLFVGFGGDLCPKTATRPSPPISQAEAVPLTFAMPLPISTPRWPLPGDRVVTSSRQQSPTMPVTDGASPS